MQRFVSQFRESIVENPITWALVALLTLAIYGNYQRGRELSRICDLLGPHDIRVSNPRTPQEEIDNICISRQSD